MAYGIGQFQALNEPGRMVVTMHSRRRFAERGIRLKDVCEAIEAGEVIEDYPNDYPFPSCLILGRGGGRPLHVCASIHDGMIYLITAYHPDPAKWQPDWRTRQEADR